MSPILMFSMDFTPLVNLPSLAEAPEAAGDPPPPIIYPTFPARDFMASLFPSLDITSS